MNKYLSIDVGTTCCKCQLFDERGEVLEYHSKEYPFKMMDGYSYIDIDAIKENVFSMIKEIGKNHLISSICISSLGESFVLLDQEDNILFYPMIYTDPRGEEEAKEINLLFKEEVVFEKTGSLAQGMYSISKLLFIKKHYQEIYCKADKVLLICDYLTYLLSNERIIDYSLATRTGIFNINTLSFDVEMLNKLEIPITLFSTPKPTGTIVGKIRQELKNKLSLPNDMIVVLGSHDQICNAIGCGCIHKGQATDGIGTVECITSIFDFKSKNFNMAKAGYPIVPFLKKGLYCTYICNFASNSITNWFKNEIAHNYKEGQANFFEYMEEKMDDSINDILCLPYFAGSCIPYQDTQIKGAFLGLTTSIKDYELYKSILEGLAMEMRFEVDYGKQFGIEVSELVCTGGGSLSKKRLQMKSTIQNIKVSTLRSQEGGLCGCACLSAVALKQFASLEEACSLFVKTKEAYTPNKFLNKQYETKYQKYIKIYKQIKEIN